MRKRAVGRVGGLLLSLVCAGGVSVYAQTVPANVPLTASFSHDGQNTTGYRFRVDGGTTFEIPFSALVGGVVSTTLPGQAAGTHTLIACAYNTIGEACTAPLTFTAVSPQPPNVPTNLTITVQIAMNSDGSVTLVAAAVEKK